MEKTTAMLLGFGAGVGATLIGYLGIMILKEADRQLAIGHDIVSESTRKRRLIDANLTN